MLDNLPMLRQDTLHLELGLQKNQDMHQDNLLMLRQDTFQLCYKCVQNKQENNKQTNKHCANVVSEWMTLVGVHVHDDEDQC